MFHGRAARTFYQPLVRSARRAPPYKGITMGIVLQLRPQRPAVAEACRWHEATESIAASNLKILCAWQRMLWRAWWGL